MRAIRISRYSEINKPPSVTTVTTEKDLAVPVEEFIRVITKDADAYIATEVFEVGDDIDMPTLTMAAMAKQRDKQAIEVDQACTFLYYAQMLPRVNVQGTISMSKMAPIRGEDLKEPLRQLASHPNYQHQTIVGFGKDYTLVWMQDGKVEIRDPRPVTEAPKA